MKSIQTQRHAYVLQYLENVDLLYLCMPDIQVRSVEGSLGLNNYVTVPIAQYLNLGNWFVYYVMKSDIDCICHPRMTSFTPPLFNKVISCTKPGK